MNKHNISANTYRKTHDAPVFEPPQDDKIRLEPLAVLPVFWKLEGRRVLLVGGSEGAAWKAELLAASGAHVDIICAEPEAEMLELLARGASAGSLQLHQRPWSINDFDLAALALADLEEDAEAHAFYCAAKAAKVPVNVIDNPKYCEFQFGSIVNRSPVVVGISTDGAAPILGQAIRRKIETLLPNALATAGALAKAFRDELKARIPDKSHRRLFWEKFVDRAFMREPVSQEVLLGLTQETIETADKAGLGRVTLVGSGPGEAELLTLKAVRAMQAADVIMYDNLTSDDILELARREARRVEVGKRGGMKSCKQDDINALMIRFALEGKRVVRLKGGDPMVFGRAGEEISDLLAAGIPVDVVPGITAASGAAAALRVSLTHRDHAQSVRFVTGHSKRGEIPENLHWQGMASGDTTLIFYMAARTADEVSQNLIKHGMGADTPVVIVANASRANQRVWQGELQHLASGVQDIRQGDPIIIGVGTVFSMYTPVEAGAVLSETVPEFS